VRLTQVPAAATGATEHPLLVFAPCA